MTTFQSFCLAAATFFCLPAFAHDGVHISDAYARTTGGAGGNAAAFFTVENHQTMDDQLLSVASDAAKRVELHRHSMDANGVMRMTHILEGFAIPGNGSHALARGGDHVMMMGLSRDFAPGDMITLTLTFQTAGQVVVDVPVDNTRAASPMPTHAAQDHSAHGQMADPANLTDVQAVTDVIMAQLSTTKNPVTKNPVTKNPVTKNPVTKNPVTVDLVTINGDHALAAWSQGDRGGRALAQRSAGLWTLLLCGGADLRNPDYLRQQGVLDAAGLSAAFNLAEDQLGADKTALYAGFAGVASPCQLATP